MPANRSDRVLRVHIQTKPSIYKYISAKHIPNQLESLKTRNNYSKKHRPNILQKDKRMLSQKQTKSQKR